MERDRERDGEIDRERKRQKERGRRKGGKEEGEGISNSTNIISIVVFLSVRFDFYLRSRNIIVHGVFLCDDVS